MRQCSCQVVAVQPQPPVAEPQASNEVPESAPAPPSQAPTLLSKLVKAHAARISEVLVLRDSHGEAWGSDEEPVGFCLLSPALRTARCEHFVL